MKPKDLLSPFSWEKRHICIQDRVLFLPKFYSRYEEWSFPGWEDSSIFGNDNPVHIEYCSGNGTWIAAKAEQFPHINWVAVEIKFPRVQKIWSKVKNRSLHNVWIVCGEAYMATHHFFPSSSVARAYVNFPDPWPKKRHAKHRLIHPDFANEVKRILQPGSDWILVTDHEGYSQQMIDTIQGNGRFVSVLPPPHYVCQWPGYGSSTFDELWREKGKQIRYHQLRKS